MDPFGLAFLRMNEDWSHLLGSVGGLIFWAPIGIAHSVYLYKRVEGHIILVNWQAPRSFVNGKYRVSESWRTDSSLFRSCDFFVL